MMPTNPMWQSVETDESSPTGLMRSAGPLSPSYSDTQYEAVLWSSLAAIVPAT